MVKDMSRDGNLKKKRKSSSAVDADNDGDVYKKAIDFEEKEALSRPNDADAKIYFEACTEIRKLLAEIDQLKSKSTLDAKTKIAEKTTEICLKIVLLKKLNRMEKVRLVHPKEQLSVEKQKVDSINLQYQNLLYEANHLKAEYRKCFQFKSKDEDIELVPITEFLTEAPVSLTEKFQALDDADEAQKHELRLARLEWELQQRIHLAEMCKQLEEEKKKLELDITERKNKLDKLDPLLAVVMEATKPVQEHLGLHIDKTQAEHKLACLLPHPLYLFYANVDAYRQVNDQTMTVEIVGDQDEAIQFKEQETESISMAEEDDEPSDIEQETQESEEIVETKKRRHRKSVVVDPLEEKKNKLLQLHPLSIQVTLTTKDGPSCLIKFNYCTKLELVTVEGSVNTPNLGGNAAKEVLSDENVLVELVPGDFGIESPNPCTAFQLKKVGVNSFRNLVSRLGHVYEWAQRICGTDFLAKQQNVKPNPELLCQTTIEFVMKTIKKRLKSRYALAKQLEELEKNIIPILPSTVDLPKTSVSALTKWNSATYQDFCQAEQSEALVAADLVQPNDVFYSVTIARDAAQLQAFIVIKNDYPNNAPIFSLCFTYKNEKRHSQNDDNIRDLERLINCEWKYEGSNAHWLLSAQVTSLCIGLDIYLETEEPQTFKQSTMYIKATCSRNRKKPFKFRNIGMGVFTQ